MTTPHPDSPEGWLRKLAVAMYSNGYHDRIAGSSVGVTPNNLGHAEPIMNYKVSDTLAKLDEYYTNKFLEIVGSQEYEDVTGSDDTVQDRRDRITRNHLRAELRQAIKQLSKRGE